MWSRRGKKRKKLSTFNGPKLVKPNLLDYISSRLNSRFWFGIFYCRKFTAKFYAYFWCILKFAQISPHTHLAVTLKVPKILECCEC